MTDSASRQPKGIPVGGQFAATSHAEPELGLASPRRPELEGWPSTLPDPQVSFTLGDDGVITTSVEVGGEPAFEIWNPGDDVHSTETTVFVHPELEHDDVAAAAENWSTLRHNEIASDLRAEMRAATERSRARVLAKATGVPQQQTDNQLAAIIETNSHARSQSVRDVELASTALAARKILEVHPNAAYAEIRTCSWDNGEFVDGAVIKDSSYTQLHDLQDEGDDTAPESKTIVDLLKNLEAEPHNSYWSGAFSTGSYGDEIYTIDLRRAAAWAPGGEA